MITLINDAIFTFVSDIFATITLAADIITIVNTIALMQQLILLLILPIQSGGLTRWTATL